MKKIAVLVSGGGTNLQQIIDEIRNGSIQNAQIALVISSSDKAYALERAKLHNIKSAVLSKDDAPNSAALDKALVSILDGHGIDLVVLAGYLRILGKQVTQRYANQIINVHPSLIPSFCGEGYYGLKVHEAVLEYGVKITGATVHFVNEITDGGAIIFQKAVEVLPDDTPKALQLRVMREAEWVLLPRAIHCFCNDQIAVEGRKITIKGERTR